jgi:hypothetical protein
MIIIIIIIIIIADDEIIIANDHAINIYFVRSTNYRIPLMQLFPSSSHFILTGPNILLSSVFFLYMRDKFHTHSKQTDIF